MLMPVERDSGRVASRDEGMRREGVDRARLNPQPNVQMERPQFHGAINQVSLVAQWRSGSGRCAGLQLVSCKRGAVEGLWK